MYTVPVYKTPRQEKKALRALEAEVKYIYSQENFRPPLAKRDAVMAKLSALFMAYPDREVLYAYYCKQLKASLRITSLLNSIIAGIAVSLFVSFCVWLYPSLGSALSNAPVPPGVCGLVSYTIAVAAIGLIVASFVAVILLCILAYLPISTSSPTRSKELKCLSDILGLSD